MKLRIIPLLIAFLFTFIVPVNCAYETREEGAYTYEQAYSIKKNYRLKIEEAVKNSLNAHSLKVQNNMIFQGDISPSGKLTNIKITQSSGNTRTDEKVVSALKALPPFTMAEKSFMPASFSLSLFAAPKYSGENYVLILSLFKKERSVISQSEWSAYIASLEEKIKQRWDPKNLNNKTLKTAIVHFSVKKTGQIDDVCIIKSSDDKAFDSLVLQTIKNSAPFAPLPAAIKGDSVPIDYALSNQKYVKNPQNGQKGSFWENFSKLNNEYYQRYQNTNPWM